MRMRKKGERITSLHDFRKKGHSKLENINKKKYPTFDVAIFSKFLKSLKYARLAFLEFVSTILPTFYVTNSNEKMFHHIVIFHVVNGKIFPPSSFILVCSFIREFRGGRTSTVGFIILMFFGNFIKY